MAPDAVTETREGVTYQLVRQRSFTRARQFNSCHDFAFRLQAMLKQCDADVLFCLNYFDAYAAVRARTRYAKRYRVIFQSVGIPTRRYFRAVPLDAWFMHTILREVDQFLVLSHFAQESLLRDFGRPSQVVPPPVQTDQFASGGHELESVGVEEPWILFVGAVEEPRKGAEILCRAFEQIKRHYRNARLIFAGHASVATQERLLGVVESTDIRESIRFLGLGDVSMLPALYRLAAVTVLPAVWEAFGLVLVESLAAGTPVVGARHGGIPDIINSTRVGTLFEPGDARHVADNLDGLIQSLLQVLDQGKTSEVSQACQARAEEFSWKRLGPRYLELLANEGNQ